MASFAEVLGVNIGLVSDDIDAEHSLKSSLMVLTCSLLLNHHTPYKAFQDFECVAALVSLGIESTRSLEIFILFSLFVPILKITT